MRIWLKPDRLAQLKLTPGDVAARDQRAERAVRRRQGRPGADRRQAGPRLHDHDAGPARRPEGVRRDHRARQSRRLDGAPRRRRARRARLEGLRLHRPLQRQGGDAGRHLPRARRQRARGREDACRTASPTLAQTLSRRASPTRFRTTRRASSRCRSREVVKTLAEAMLLVFLVVYLFLQSWRATMIPFVAVPVSLIGTFAGLYAARLLDQHADAVRHGARDRHRRRRRDRRAGERRAHHARGEAARRARPRSRRCAR